MIKSIKRITTQFVLIIFMGSFIALTMACGGATSNDTDSNTSSTNSTESANNFTTNLKLSFNLTLTIDALDDDLDLIITLVDAYSMDMNLAQDGTITIQAKDLPKMVYRVCALDSTESDCDTTSDATGGFDVDLVIDSCGRLVDDRDCGSSDDTIFSGELDNDGNMSIDDISLRIRTFAITSDSNGFTADDTDEGLLVFKRLIIDLTTATVSSGDLIQTGSLVSSNEVTLVSAGSISSTVPELGGADFLAVLEGEFNKNPFNLMD